MHNSQDGANMHGDKAYCLHCMYLLRRTGLTMHACAYLQGLS